MTEEPPRAADAPDMTAAYEAARAQATGRDIGPAHGRGVVLLMTRGMVSWMETMPGITIPAGIREEGTAPILSPEATRPEVARILAGMVLSHLTEVSS